MSATEVIDSAVHLHIDHVACDCDWDDESHIGNGVLNALKTAGYAVIEKPWADSDRPDSWLGGEVTTTRGLGRVRLYQDDHRHTPTEAREIAAALLAAADRAEATE